MTAAPLRLGAGLVLLLCAGPVRGDDAPGRGRAEGPELEVHLELRHGDGRAADVFAAGEALALVVSVRNRTDGVRHVPLATAQTHDFRIEGADGREVWSWSAGRSFAQMLTELVLPPGEERSFRATWRPDPGLAPGRYRAEAWIGTRRSGLRALPVDFLIE